MIKWALKKLVARLPYRTIVTDGKPYLTRFYLWPRGPRTDNEEITSKSPFAVFIHFFHRGDGDRDQHSHPWTRSFALILTGGYREERGDKVRVLRPGMINMIDSDDFHRVDLLDPKNGCWTIFVAGRPYKDWGFNVDGTFVPQEEYIARKDRMSLKNLQAFAREELEKMRPAEGTPALSETSTPYAVICHEHGQQFLTDDEYGRQLCRPDARWTCPRCGEVSNFDDDHYEASLNEEPPPDWDPLKA